VLAGSGAVATIYVKQFTNEAQTEFAAAKAIHNQATEFLLETQKQAVNTLLRSEEASNALKAKMDEIQKGITITSSLAEQLHDAVKTTREENLAISDSLAKEISSLRSVVDEIASRQAENDKIMKDLRGIQDRIGATNELIEKRRELGLFNEQEIDDFLRALKGPPLLE
jgi:hypothetical protein